MFTDQRKTLTKRHDIPRGWDEGPATARRIAPPEFDPDALRPALNRASRRAQGRYRSRHRAAMRRHLLRATRKPVPWKPGETEENAA